VDTVALALNGLELSDGRTVDLDMEINGLDYEIFTTDDLRVDNVRFSADISDPADTVTVTAAYSDADLSDTHSISIDTSGTAGLVTDNGDGTFSYDANGQFEHLAAGETATDTFTYTVDDGNGGTDTETVTVTITGANDAPVALAVAAEVSENPQTAGSDSIGAYTVPNYGRFYIYDFDTGTAASVARDGGANNTFAQVANTYLSNGNGVVVQPNPNNTGWGLGGEIFVDGVAQPVSSSDWVVSGGNGDVNLTHPQWLSFGENNENISSIELTISDLDLGGGRTVDAHVSVGPLNYEYYTGDDLRVDGVQFSSAVNGPSPSVTVAADVSDPDSDTFVFSTDTSGTAGEVTNNGDGTFTYSANGQFEHLNDGETATDTFGYTVSDGNGGFDSELVTITILGSDDILFS
jgi:VCBS repeat-containing protein